MILKAQARPQGKFVTCALGVGNTVLETQSIIWSDVLCTILRSVRTQSTYKMWFLSSSSLSSNWISHKWDSYHRTVNAKCIWMAETRSITARNNSHQLGWLWNHQRRVAIWLESLRMKRNEMLLFSFFTSYSQQWDFLKTLGFLWDSSP